MTSTKKGMNEELDKSVKKFTEHLHYKGILETKLSNTTESYYQLLDILKESFVIPQTSITKIMSRLLFNIGMSKKPKIMVGAGTYTGNALAWLSGYYLLNESLQNVRIYGLDISSEATKIAQSNFSSIKASEVMLEETDAIEWVRKTNEKIDLLYIDIDTADEGKSRYIDLLNAAYPKLSEGALILAHDVNETKFIDDMKPFINELLDQSKYKASVNLNVDPYGLSITIKGDSYGDI